MNNYNKEKIVLNQSELTEPFKNEKEMLVNKHGSGQVTNDDWYHREANRRNLRGSLLKEHVDKDTNEIKSDYDNRAARLDNIINEHQQSKINKEQISKTGIMGKKQKHKKSEADHHYKEHSG